MNLASKPVNALSGLAESVATNIDVLAGNRPKSDALNPFERIGAGLTSDETATTLTSSYR